MLSWTGDPAVTMTFCWRDDSQMEARVQVVPETLYRQTGFTEAVEFAAVCTDVSLDGSGAWRYEAAADGRIP